MKKIILIFTAVLTLLTVSFCFGQNAVQVDSLRESSTNPLFLNVWTYVAGNGGKVGTTSQALYHTTVTNTHALKGYSFETGILLELKKKKTPFHIPFVMGIGYKFERFAYSLDNNHNSGVYSHWLTAKLEYNYVFLVGLKTDILLTSNNKNDASFNYEGLYRDCLNKAAFCWYVGLSMPLAVVNVTGRIGSYMVPLYNPQKIAYYNMGNSHVNGLFLSFRVLSDKSDGSDLPDGLSCVSFATSASTPWSAG